MPAHLHVHSSYSTQDGMIRPKDLVKRVKEMGLSAACITDHGNLRAAPSLWKACQEEEVKCILGIEAYLAPKSRKDKKIEGLPNAYHLVLLAKNHSGWKNLVKLASIAELEGFYHKPRIDWELLGSDLANDLIVLSACMQGEIPYALRVAEDEKEPDLDAKLAQAVEITKKYRKRFGDDFFIEIQAHEVEGQKELNNILCHIASHLDIPLVATCDSHFLNKEDYKAHQALIALQRGTNIKKLGEYYGPWFYIQSPDEMKEYLPEDYAYEAIAMSDMIVSQIEDYEIGLNPKKFYLVSYGVGE